MLISPKLSASVRGNGNHGEKKCRNCHILEGKLKDILDGEREVPSRKQSEKETNSVNRLKEKVEQLKEALRVADQRIAAQKQVERKSMENIDALRKILHTLEETQTTGGGLDTDIKQMNNQLNDQEKALREEGFATNVATEDIGVQTKTVGVVFFSDPKLKGGMFVQMLQGSERRTMALRVDYALRLLVLTRRDTIKFIPVLDVVRIVTTSEKLRRLLEKEGNYRQDVRDEELNRIVAFFVEAGKSSLPLFIVLPSEHLRNTLVAHVTQLRFSAEVERGHLTDKGFHGEHLTDGWLDDERGKKYGESPP